ncbi:MAG: divalent metal cation transporter [Fuerstiella sp.]
MSEPNSSLEPVDPRLEADRYLLQEAQASGMGATLKAFVKLSGPGWLQSAITLGGGSLGGALFLGILGGTDLLWLQLVAIVMGVIMLSAISYVTLSTGKRPFRLINNHINPALGWGWIIATMLANMIWCMPQFGLCFAALQKNLLPTFVDNTDSSKQIVSLIVLLAATIAVFLNSRPGIAMKIFDWTLKGLIAIVVICFVGVVVLLTKNGALNWGEIFSGFIPNLSQWNNPTGKLAELISPLPQNVQDFWNEAIVSRQRDVMIAAAATAVGINMTFLMPYSMLRRRWDRNFRGLSRFDLSTGMAIPYIVVTSCVVIAAASQFHAQSDEKFLSSEVETVKESPLFAGASGTLLARIKLADPETTLGDEGQEEALAEAIAAMPRSEKILAAATVKRNAFDLASAISPLLGDQNARLAFGLGIFGMGFSTIIILMLINGFAVCELANKPLGGGTQFFGSMVAGIVGFMWWRIWQGDNQIYLTIVASKFGMMLLPIAYITFFMMMNSKSILGADRPKGASALVWNALMLFSVAGAIVAAGSAIYGSLTSSKNPNEPYVVGGLLAVYSVAIVLGFAMKKKVTE